MPIAYWVSENILYIFQNSSALGDIAKCCTGMQTVYDKYIRLWYEVNINETSILVEKKRKWFKYNCKVKTASGMETI